MTLLGIALVLMSAVLHASWNFLLKRSGASGAAFTWLFTMPSVVVLTPVIVLLRDRLTFSFTVEGLLWLGGSAIIHTAYFLILQRGYVLGDLSVVYPVARGSGPLLASLIAVTLLGERPTLVASFGALAIVGGTFVLAMQNTRGLAAAPTFVEKKGKISRSVAYGLMVGAFIGVYTVWDKYLVSTLEVSPIVLEWALSIAIAAIVSPVALRDRRALAESWRRHKVTAIVGAALGSGSYILFLTALRVLPVSRAAPLRESSVLIGTFLGARFLAEGSVRQRLAAAAVITAGILLLSLG